MEIFNISQLFTHLKQDEQSDIKTLKLLDGTMSFLIAELQAGKKLSAHYHNEGSEIYHILSGKGSMEIGELSDNTVIWSNCFKVKSGDVFEVKPRIVHRLSNDSSEALRIIFFAPPSHLDDDRVFL